jgi:uroporphyrinogen-III synthase
MLRSSPKIALLEARMSGELARLVANHGGDPICVPGLREQHELTPEGAGSILGSLVSGTHQIVVFMTSVAVSLLFEASEKLGRRAELVTALNALTTIARGPKPAAALRGFGVSPTLTARESFTSAEVIDALGSIHLEGKRVLLFHYGERSESLAETLAARGAVVDEQWLYRWHLPEDTSGLEGLVQRIMAGEIDALAVTCQVQFRHLFQVAEHRGNGRNLIDALNGRIVIGAVGPTCKAILHAHGVKVDVVPEYPNMAPLVVALMKRLERGTTRVRSRQAAVGP